MADAPPIPLASRAIDRLDVSPAARVILNEIHAEVAAAYQASFVEMVQAIRQQASAIDRIQTTLMILVKQIAPALENQLPAAIRVAQSGERPDLASAVVLADPIGAGYTMSQADIAQALGITQPDVSVLIRAFKLPEDGRCAVVVRRGNNNRTTVVNYHPRTIERFKALLARPPQGLTGNQKNVLTRVRAKLLMA